MRPCIRLFFRCLSIILLLSGYCDAAYKNSAQVTLQSFQYELINQQESIYRLESMVETYQATLEALKKRLDKQGEEITSSFKKKNDSYSAKQGQFEKELKKTNERIDFLFKQIKSIEDVVNRQSIALEHIKNSLNSILQVVADDSVNDYESYTVKAGDSLEKIARKFNTKIRAIKESNHLESDRILIGQTLKIPKS